MLANDGAGGAASEGRGGKPENCAVCVAEFCIGAACIDGSSRAGGGEIDAKRSSGGVMLFVVLLIAGGSDGAALVLAND